MDKIKYQLSDGTVCSQDELTGKQDVALLRLLAKIKLDEKSFSEATMLSLMNMLVENDLLPEFFSIILIDETGAIASPGIKAAALNWKNSEYERIIKDFFVLNPTAMKLFENFVPKLDSMNLTRISSSIKTKLESAPTTGGEPEKLS